MFWDWGNPFGMTHACMSIWQWCMHVHTQKWGCLWLLCQRIIPTESMGQILAINHPKLKLTPITRLEAQGTYMTQGLHKMWRSVDEFVWVWKWLCSSMTFLRQSQTFSATLLSFPNKRPILGILELNAEDELEVVGFSNMPYPHVVFWYDEMWHALPP